MSEPIQSAVTINWEWEGRRLCDSDSGHMYLVMDGRLRAVPGPDTFKKLFRGGAESPAPLPAVLPPGPNPDRDAELLQLSDGRVFLVSGGKRRHVRDPAAMDRYGFAWEQIVGVPDDILATIPSGQPIPASIPE